MIRPCYLSGVDTTSISMLHSEEGVNWMRPEASHVAGRCRAFGTTLVFLKFSWLVIEAVIRILIIQRTRCLTYRAYIYTCCMHGMRDNIPLLTQGASSSRFYLARFSLRRTPQTPRKGRTERLAMAMWGMPWVKRFRTSLPSCR